ncbi:MAG: histidine kinase, partial [bacterium]|nr:histidine kinase [bacterium]
LDRMIETYNTMIDQLREERLKLQEKNYFIEKVLVASPSVIITFDFDDRIAHINPAGEKILDLNHYETAGKKLSEIDRQYARDLEKLDIGESKVIPFNGSRKLKCWKAEFLDKGFKRNFILIEELTEELRQTEKSAYEKLIRIMAHEVNNSIGAANSLLHSCMNYKNQLREEDRGDFERALNVV